MLHEEITGKIIGCSMRVHSEIGPGFMESVYNRCLQIEFRLENISFECEKEFPFTTGMKK
jgi:GxxExxY protein